MQEKRIQKAGLNRNDYALLASGADSGVASINRCAVLVCLAKTHCTLETCPILEACLDSDVRCARVSRDDALHT